MEPDAAELIRERAMRMYPALAEARPLAAYAGLRPAGRDANYVIERSRTLPGLIHVAAIRSTGLSASLGIGEHVVGMLAGPGNGDRSERATPAVPPARRAAPWWRRGATPPSQRLAGRSVSGDLLLGIDEGTTAVKAALFDVNLRPVAQASRRVALAHPRPGWVEQDPELILEAVVDAVAEVLERAGGREVLAAGLDHQGESVLAWDAGEAAAR